MRNCEEWLQTACKDFDPKAIEWRYKQFKEKFIKPMDKWLTDQGLYGRVMNQQGRWKIKELLENIAGLPQDIDDWIPEMFAWAEWKTDRDTHQAMESLIHNLNSLACFPPNERLWVYDTVLRRWYINSFADIYRRFQKGRFKVLSVNPKTGKTEVKDLLEIREKANTEQMVRVTDITGNSVVHTISHRHMTIDDNCEIKYAAAPFLQYTTMPRNFEMPVDQTFDVIDISKNSPKKPYLLTPAVKMKIEYSRPFAELLGYYAADGYITRDGSSMVFGSDTNVSVYHILDLIEAAFGFRPKFEKYFKPRVHQPNIERTSNVFFYVGVHIGRMIRQIAGTGAEGKVVPDFVLCGSKELQTIWLRAYLAGDGCRTRKYIEFSTVSRTLFDGIKTILAMQGEVLTSRRDDPEIRNKSSKWKIRRQVLYTGILGRKAAERLDIADTCLSETSFEIPKYDLNHCLKQLKKAKIPWGELPRVPRRHVYNRLSSGLRYEELASIEMPKELQAKLRPMENVFRIPVRSIEYLETTCDTVYDIGVADNENFMLHNGLIVHNCRAGSQVPFSSVNTGLDTTPEGRMVTKNLFLSQEEGLGNGETPIFPITIMKLKKGITDPGSPNYDLFQLSCRVSAHRLLPNWVNMDAPFNLRYYKVDKPETHVATMGMIDGGQVRIYHRPIPNTLIDDTVVSTTIDISQLGEYLLSHNLGRLIQDANKPDMRLVEVTEAVSIWDDFKAQQGSTDGWTPLKYWMYDTDPNLTWYRITTDRGFNQICSGDHPLYARRNGQWVRTRVDELREGDTLCGNRGLDHHITCITHLKLYTQGGYDVNTGTEKFSINSIVSGNCRTLVMSNIHNPKNEISVGRGNLFMLNLSLPYLALELKEEEPTLTGQALIDAYFDKVKYYMEEAFDSLLDRFEIIARRKVYNFPFLMGQGLYLDSEKLGPDDEIREVIKNGTLTVGFIGLSEALVALTGKHHGESPDSQKLGLKIVGFMCDMCKAKALETKLNFSLMGSPAEGAAGRLLRCARKRFGVVEGVTDKEWFTNSHHVDVRYPISAWDKINIEAPYHALEPAG